jgi:hypothetical protein
MTPRYQHDCDGCQFQGQHTVGETEVDAYWCPKCDGGSVILRYGDDGPEYASSPHFVLTDAYLNDSTRQSKEFMLMREIVARMMPR